MQEAVSEIFSTESNTFLASIHYSNICITLRQTKSLWDIFWLLIYHVLSSCSCETPCITLYLFLFQKLVNPHNENEVQYVIVGDNNQLIPLNLNHPLLHHLQQQHGAVQVSAGDTLFKPWIVKKKSQIFVF